MMIRIEIVIVSKSKIMTARSSAHLLILHSHSIVAGGLLLMS